MATSLTRLGLALSLVGWLLTPAAAQDGTPFTSNYGQVGARVDSPRELGGAFALGANSRTTVPVSCAAGSITASTITVNDASGFDPAGGGGAVVGNSTGTPPVNMLSTFHYGSISGNTFQNLTPGEVIADRENAGTNKCPMDFPPGSRVYALDGATNLGEFIKVLQSAVQNSEQFDCPVALGSSLPANNAAKPWGCVKVIESDGLSCTSTNGTKVLLCDDTGTDWVARSASLTGLLFNCPVGSAPTGINNAGDAQNCTDMDTQAEANAHAALTTAHGATDVNTPNTIVRRDAAGNFSAGTMTGTATLAGQFASPPVQCNPNLFATGIQQTGEANCAPLPLPSASTPGVVIAKTCTAPDKVSALNTDGTLTCTPDQTGPGGGGGITSFEGESLSTQTVTDDVNVTWTPNIGTGVHVLGWTGLLGLSRGGTNANLATTGGLGQVLMQISPGAAVSVRALLPADLPTASTTTQGAVQFATSGQATAGLAVQANDGRLNADQIRVNTVDALNAGNFSDTTPAAPANAVNVKWLKDTASPNNISASVPTGGGAGTVVAGDDGRITGAEQVANKGATNGYAPLVGGKVPYANMLIGQAPNTVMAGDDPRLALAEQTTHKNQGGGYAGLDTTSKVLQNPASADLTPAAGKIPLAKPDGKIDTGWMQDATAFVPGILTAEDWTRFNAVGVEGAQGQALRRGTCTQLVDVPPTASSVLTTSCQIPADATVLSVPVYVFAQPAGTLTMTVSAATSGTMFQTGTSMSTVTTTANPGNKPGPAPYGGVAQQPIRLDFNTAATGAGQIRVDIFYETSTAATS